MPNNSLQVPSTASQSSAYTTATQYQAQTKRSQPKKQAFFLGTPSADNSTATTPGGSTAMTRRGSFQNAGTATSGDPIHRKPSYNSFAAGSRSMGCPTGLGGLKEKLVEYNARVVAKSSENSEEEDEEEVGDQEVEKEEEEESSEDSSGDDSPEQSEDGSEETSEDELDEDELEI